MLQNERQYNPYWRYEHMPGASIDVVPYIQMMISGQKPPRDVLNEMQEEALRNLELEKQVGFSEEVSEEVGINKE